VPLPSFTALKVQSEERNDVRFECPANGDITNRRVRRCASPPGGANQRYDPLSSDEPLG
jgi:hypothetical protein